MNRRFKGIWISSEIWLNSDLSILEKVILAEIDSLSSPEQGCFASNAYFAEFFGVSERRIRQVITKLVDDGFVIRHLETTLKGSSRKLWVNLSTRGEENFLPGGEENCQKGGRKFPPYNKDNNKDSLIITMEWMPSDEFINEAQFIAGIPRSFFITDALPGFLGHHMGKKLENPEGMFLKWVKREWEQYGGRDRHYSKIVKGG